MTTTWQCAEPTEPGSQALRDAGLIVRVLAGERDLFHELVRPYEKRIYLLILRMLRNREEAEDAAQDTMLKAFKKLDTFRSASRFSTWLISIAVNEARMRLRRDRVLRFESMDHAPEGEGDLFTPVVIADKRGMPLQALQRNELRRMLQFAIASLPETYREVLQLRDVEELSIRETTAMLGVNNCVVKSRLFRARRMMRKILIRQSAHRLNAGLKPEKGSITVLRPSRDRVYERRSKSLRTYSRQKDSTAIFRTLNPSTQLTTGRNEVATGAFRQAIRELPRGVAAMTVGQDPERTGFAATG